LAFTIAIVVGIRLVGLIVCPIPASRHLSRVVVQDFLSVDKPGDAHVQLFFGIGQQAACIRWYDPNNHPTTIADIRQAKKTKDFGSSLGEGSNGRATLDIFHCMAMQLEHLGQRRTPDNIITAVLVCFWRTGR
jgi:hypothetical protein